MVEKASEKGSDSRPLEDEVAALKADMARLRTDIGRLTAALGATVSDYGEDIQDKVRGRAADARARAAEQLDQAADVGRKAVGDLEQGIAQRPIASLLTAATFGFIIAKLLDLGGRR